MLRMLHLNGEAGTDPVKQATSANDGWAATPDHDAEGDCYREIAAAAEST